MENKDKKTMGVEFVEKLVAEMRQVDFEDYFNYVTESRTKLIPFHDKLNQLYIDQVKRAHERLIEAFGKEMADEIIVAQMSEKGGPNTTSMLDEVGKGIASLIIYQLQQKYAYQSAPGGGVV